MTLHESCMDESDVDRDISDVVDINLVKKLTSKLPKSGSRVRAMRDTCLDSNPDVNNNSRFSIAGSDVSEDPSEASHADRGADGDSSGPESKQEHCQSPEISARPDGSVLSPNPNSNSLDSCGDGSFDRMKRKPLIQRMLEKAREEDKDHSRHDNPLFKGIDDKAQVDSDLEDNIKNEEYENSAAQRRMKLPKMKKLSRSPSRDHGPQKGSKGIGYQQSPNSLSESKSPTKMNNNARSLDPLIIGPRSRVKGTPSPIVMAPSPSNDSVENVNSSGNGNANSNSNGNSANRRKNLKKPLYQRLIEKAQIEEERVIREKMDQYNLVRMRKRGSNAPSKEEIKERVEQGIARNDHLILAHHQLRKEQEEKDKDIDRLRESYRITKKQNKIVDILLPSMSVLSVLTSNSIPVSSARSEQNTLSLKRALPPVKRNNVKLKVVTDNNSNNDDDDDGYKNDDCSEVNQRKAAVKKIKLKSLRPSPKRRLSQPQSMRKNGDYREQCRSTELEKVPVTKNRSEKTVQSEIVEIPLISLLSKESLISSLNMSSCSLGDECAVNDIHAVNSPVSLVSLDSADSFIRDLKGMHTGISTASNSGVLCTGEITERNKGGNDHIYQHHHHNNYNKKDKEKKMRNGRSINKNEFDFCFDDMEGQSLIDDLDDNLLAKKNNKLRKSLETPNSRVRFVSTDGSKSGETSSSSFHEIFQSNLLGLQWVSDVLESDENEIGLTMMYSEGFSIFMLEQGSTNE